MTDEGKRNSEGSQEDEEIKQEGSTVTGREVDLCRRLSVEYSASSIQRNLTALKDYPEAKRNFPVYCSLGFIHKGSFLVYHLQGENLKSIDFTHKQSIHLTELIRLSTSSSSGSLSSAASAVNRISKGTVILQVGSCFIYYCTRS